MNRSIIAALVAAATAAVSACGDGNRQSINVSGSSGGNISQNQSGYGNSQSMNIGSVDGKTPSISQSQSGVNREQSMTIDGKKVEMKDK